MAAASESEEGVYGRFQVFFGERDDLRIGVPERIPKPRTSALSLAGDSTIAVSNIVGIPITTASESPILPSSRSNPGSRNVIAIIAELSRTVP